MPFLQTSKIKFRRAKQFAKAYPDTRWQSQDLKPANLTPGITLLPMTLQRGCFPIVKAQVYYSKLKTTCKKILK